MNGSNKPVVLVVDDAAESIDVARGALGSEFHVKAAINGAKALELATLHKPDLILLDVMMPDMSGYDVCLRLKADYTTSDIPVIFVSAIVHEQSKNKQGYPLYVGQRFLPKPVDIQRLVDAIEELSIETHQRN